MNEASSGWALPLGWARPVYINRHPQPPAKYIGFSERSKVTLCYRILQEYYLTGPGVWDIVGSRKR